MRSPPSAQRLLVVRVGAMGDVIHALPAVAALRAFRPELCIHWVVDPRWAPLLMGADGSGPVISDVHLAETGLWSRAPLSRQTRQSVLALRRDLASGHFDLAVDMQGTLRSAVIGAFAGARCYAGFATPREPPARWLYKHRAVRSGTHIVEQGAALLGQALGISLAPLRSFPLPVSPAAERWAEDLLATLPTGRPAALLVPSAGWGAKQWPTERFAALAEKLAATGFNVLVNAVAETDVQASAIVAQSARTARTARLVVCNVRDLIALTRRVDVVIGGDSGPLHLAAALGVPLVALFGPTDPMRNGPWGAGEARVLRHSSSLTTYRHRARPDPGLAQIGVDEVVAAVLGLRPANRTAFERISP